MARQDLLAREEAGKLRPNLIRAPCYGDEAGPFDPDAAPVVVECVVHTGGWVGAEEQT